MRELAPGETQALRGLVDLQEARPEGWRPQGPELQARLRERVQRELRAPGGQAALAELRDLPVVLG